jgi:hypothetical protein
MGATVGTLVPDITMLIDVLYRVSYREWCIAIRIESWLSVSLHPYKTDADNLELVELGYRCALRLCRCPVYCMHVHVYAILG